MTDNELVKHAEGAKKQSYSPYSNFRVGAAVLTVSGGVYYGTNIENVSFGATSCAERNAIFSAVCDGERKIEALAISSDSENYTYPCGICRQVISEFAGKDTKIICANNKGEFEVMNFFDLLPKDFKI